MKSLSALVAALMIALSGPALAQAAPAEAPIAPPDPSRVTAAKPVIDKLWPLGTYRRMMDGTLSKMMDQMMVSMFDMPASEMAKAIDPSGEAAKAADGKTMGEMATAADPHFRERMKITMDIMMREMIPLMEKVEPQVRNNLTNIYARKFDAKQLGEMDAFFSTPTGKAYAEQSMLAFMDPEMMKSMQAFVPEMLKAMPDIMKKMEKATAHLPPVPKKRTDEE
jgi:hypothetical protein